MNRPITVSRTHRDLIAESRVSSRFASGTEVTCQPASAWGGEGVKWPGHIRDVSAEGLCVVLRRRYEPGAGLAIELPGAEGEGPVTLYARVLHVQAEGDDEWAL